MEGTKLPLLLLLKTSISDTEYIVICTETLKKASIVAPDLLLKAVDQVRLKHRNTTYCDELVSYVHSLDKPS